MRTEEICHTVRGLVAGAESAANAMATGDIDRLGECLTSYWGQKKIMAGEDAEPQVMKDIVELLSNKEVIVGASLCGAGGGGFLVMLTREGYFKDDLQHILEESEINAKHPNISWHDCQVCVDGIKLFHVEPQNETFRMEWHQ